MSKITKSSTAEYFAKNLQQVGFSSPLKAVLTTLKEAVDNSLDACEEAGIAPELKVSIKKVGKGSAKNTDLIQITVEDNGPGLELSDLPQVFGEYLASSKFGRGQCSRGQQGIGISAATTWAQLTNAAGVKVMSKTKKMRKAVSATIDVDIKGNKGLIKNKSTVDWKKTNGLKVDFKIDGRIQLNGDGGLLTYLEGTTLVNPHLTLEYDLLDNEKVKVERVSDEVPKVPPPTLPHPHTMKLGEFLTHAHLYGNLTLSQFLKKAFSRMSDNTVKECIKNGLPKKLTNMAIKKIPEKEFKTIFQSIQNTELANPSTRSVLTVGEEGLAKSIHRIGEVDFFSVVTRKPKICDFKPTVVEVAIARFLDKKAAAEEQSVQLLRFANRVPLQFDKSACAITRAVESINWKAYGLAQSKNSLPLGPYVFAISVTSPFIKFKNASKETIDASDDLVEELRRAMMQAGQKLSRHIKRENKAADLERKKNHIQSFGPALVECLGRIVNAPEKRKQKATEGLIKILGRDSKEAEKDLKAADARLNILKDKQSAKLGKVKSEKSNPQKKADESEPEKVEAVGDDFSAASGKSKKKKTSKKKASKAVKKASKKARPASKKKVAKKSSTKKTVAKKKAKKKSRKR